MYYATLTYTTVGYGDFALDPKDEGAQLFNALYAILGIAIIGWALNVIGQKMVQEQVKALAAANKAGPKNSVGGFNKLDLEPSIHDTDEEAHSKLIKKIALEKEERNNQLAERYKKIRKVG